MKRITLHRITLQNFKGAKNETHEFNGQDAVVSGKNGSGKTTIFDAFTWLLFGKDHLGRSKFDIKPLDSHGKEVGHLDVEVTATIQVDDEEITLKRIYKETWTKKRPKSCLKTRESWCMATRWACLRATPAVSMLRLR